MTTAGLTTKATQAESIWNMHQAWRMPVHILSSQEMQHYEGHKDEPNCPQLWVDICKFWKESVTGAKDMSSKAMEEQVIHAGMPLGKLHKHGVMWRGYTYSDVSFIPGMTKQPRGASGASTWSRVKNSPFLLLPPALEIVPAVGKFHLAAHKLSCFPRYSLNFIKGAGHLDGEILETLWAPFNKISPTVRSMTQAHRQEVYDDHMRDSNWKKLVGMVPSLLKIYKNSNKCLEEMNQAYEQLTAVLDPDKVARWESDALRAEADRGEALDIYLLKGDKAPTFQEVWLQLMKNSKSPLNVGSVAWLAEGISIEDSQDRDFLPGFKNSIAMAKHFAKVWIDGTFTPQNDPAFCGSDEEEHEDREFWDDDEGDWEAPEEEVEGLASELMSMTANSTREGTRTKKEIQKVVARVNKHVRSYQRARQAILRLYPDGNMAEKYQEILPEDLVVSKEVTEENRFGQGTSKLAWFWVIDGEKSQLNVEAGGLMEEFYRINWLKARARRDRWKEEVSLVRHEMLWTGLWFEYHKKMWEQRALQLTEPGKEAYAKKQMGLWSDFASKARLMFHGKQMDGI
ncbi:hypothetical protein EDC04DRAFT_2616104 [Pisolithus marmoratus]|nr:hypothetical protein EDC04DRAFT_2616104 [Pisolithus marmoratus]